MAENNCSQAAGRILERQGELTETEYVELLTSLRERFAELECLACPTLHATRQATSLRARLGLIRQPAGRSRGLKAALRRQVPWIILLAYCLRRTAALILFRIAALCLGGRAPGSCEIVLRSWVVTDIRQALARDFYLGDLPQALEKEGRRVVRLLRQAGRSSQLRFDIALLRSGAVGVLPEDWFLPVSAPMRVFVRLAACWVRMRAAGQVADGPAAVVREALIQDLSSIDTAGAMEIYYSSRAASRRLRPRVYLTFYEGYSWEPCAWRGIDDAGTCARVVGFNHTIVCRASYALLAPARSAWYRATPDLVLCAGDAQRDLLGRSHGPLAIPVRTLGSPRVIAAPEDPPAVDRSTARYDVLVLPEGILEECRLLLGMIAEAAVQAPQMRFLIRLHPVLPFHALPREVKEPVEKLPNVEVSRLSDFSSVLADSRTVLYRGSSAVLQAMTHGVVPIYYRAEGADDVDPLWEGAEVHEECSTARELIDVVSDLGARNSDWFVAWRRRSTAVARRYAMVFQSSTVRDLAVLAASGC